MKRNKSLRMKSEVRRKILLSLFIVFISISYTKAQEDKPKKFAVNGYISSMQSVMAIDSVKELWIADNLLHNRLNVFWYPTNKITGTIQLRNRLMYGDQVKSSNFLLAKRKTYFDDKDLSYNLENKSYFLQSKIDRLWFQYTLNKIELVVGRQRINWGQSFAFNPNDIFNAYSYFDFDYVERPGSDAINIKYYTGVASSLEAAIKVDSSNNITAAARAVLNKWNYDFQIIGGLLSESDWVGGFGWAGNIKSLGFRGEASYFQPKENFSDTTGLFMMSASLDYTFANSLFIQAEGLFSNVDNNTTTSLMERYNAPQNVKNLAFSKASFVISASYPINPLLNASLSGMYFLGLDGFYLGPSLSYSLKDNLDLSAYYQYFNIDPIGLHMAFLRIKQSF